MSAGAARGGVPRTQLYSARTSDPRARGGRPPRATRDGAAGRPRLTPPRLRVTGIVTQFTGEEAEAPASVSTAPGRCPRRV